LLTIYLHVGLAHLNIAVALTLEKGGKNEEEKRRGQG
jgi:hypothetical protein